MQGIFITIDGIEGVGKSTQVDLLANYLQEKKIEFILTREPGGTELGEKIRDILLHTSSQVDDTTELLLMFAARNQHIKQKIQPALSQGKFVICDRWTDATYAYQGGGREIDENKIEQLEKYIQGNFQADISIFLDLDIKTSMARIANRGAKDRIEQENLAFFQRVRDTYLARANKYPNRIVLVNANQSINTVHKNIIKALKL